MSLVKNLFADIPENLPGELVQTIFQAPAFRVERIVSQGQCSPDGFWYDQDEHEWVALLAGNAVLRFADTHENISMIPGKYIHIERHRRHRVEWTDPGRQTIWLAIYYR